MTRPATLLLATALFASACTSEEEGVTVLVPADVEFSWNVAYDAADDGLAALLPLDVMVYDAVSGEAVAGVDLVVASDTISFVASHEVLRAEADCLDCIWDAYRDEFIAIAPGVADEPLEVTTDESGLARVYALVDEVGDAAAVDVAVILGRRVETLRLLPR